MALIEKLTAIADAIRGKTGTEDKLTLEQMAEEINNLSIGSNLDEYITNTLIKYENSEVTTVKKYLFAGSTIEKVSLPNVTQLDYGAFMYCTNLKEVYLPKLEKITDIYCFTGCTSLEALNLPNLKTTSSYAFADCSALRILNVPQLTVVDAQAFRNCTSLIELYFPNVTTVYTSGFGGCSALEKVVFDKSVGFVRQTIFNNCSSLTALVLRGETLSTLSYTNVFQGTPIEAGTGYIYVPQALIEDYKVATNWITYAEQFRAIEDYPEICGGGTQ